MASPHRDGDVLVAVKSPEHVQQLVRTAADLARVGNRTVRLVTVVVKPYESPFGVFDDETIRREFAGESRALLDRVDPPDGITVERDLIVGRSVADGLVSTVEESNPAALVVGWEGPTSRVDALLGTTLDTLVARARCDLYVERVGPEANGVESVLVPVAGGPHVGTAARIATAIAAQNDARVVVLSVAGGDDGIDADAAAEFAAAGERAVAELDMPDTPVETVIREGEEVAATIIEEAADHDLVVLGATRQGAVRTRIVGSVPRRVVDRSDRTVILARSGDTAAGPPGLFGRIANRW